jgi:hypothetical protein
MPTSAATFLKIQDVESPLFPDALLPPERANLRGKILLIGGSSAGFAGISYAYNKAIALGGGEVRVILPKCLEKILPKNPDFHFVGNPKSLGFDKTAEPELLALAEWSDAVLFVGDFGRNAETALILGDTLQAMLGASAKPTLLTRDTIDLLLPALPLESPNLRLFLTFNQLQKLLKHVFYPKIITFSMPLPQFADALHKFTLTYKCGLATLAGDNFIASLGGEVVSTPLQDTKYNPLTLWGGEAAVRALLLTLWSPNPKIAGLAESIL